MCDRTQALELVNTSRARHGVPDLKWDEGLSQNATGWAQHLVDGVGHLEHSTGEQRPGQGENLYWKWTSNGEKGTFADAMQGWLNEEQKYHGEAIGEGNFADWGHYTQCLWKDTTHVGMGVATDGKGATFIVGRFSPPGNMGGQRPY
ncbi:hypothetical protein LTR66_011948 [Elasticomyces elasticus]|nr:hypothetical protein LTR66_011948 [Elasticomyces elasticus]